MLVNSWDRTILLLLDFVVSGNALHIDDTGSNPTDILTVVQKFQIINRFFASRWDYFDQILKFNERSIETDDDIWILKGWWWRRRHLKEKFYKNAISNVSNKPWQALICLYRYYCLKHLNLGFIVWNHSGMTFALSKDIKANYQFDSKTQTRPFLVTNALKVYQTCLFDVPTHVISQQCDQIGQFMKNPIYKFTYKSSPKIRWLLGLFRQTAFLK